MTMKHENPWLGFVRRIYETSQTARVGVPLFFFVMFTTSLLFGHDFFSSFVTSLSVTAVYIAVMLLSPQRRKRFLRSNDA